MSPRVPGYWYGEAAVPLHARALSAVYGALVGLRLRLYRAGLLRTRSAPVPVLVIGNRTAGGAGKTPLTIAVVQRLRDAGWTPGIASRGYGRADAGTARWVDASTDAREGGDEPVLLARRTGVRVRVDRDRVAAACALAEAGCDIVVCDDGLQHLRLHRDVEVEVIDGRRRYGNGRLLPAGPLREAPRACAFRVVNSGGPHAPDSGFGEWPMRLVGDTLQPLAGVRTRPLASFAGQRVHAVAGIADPDRFFDALRAAQVAVVPHAFPDHHAYSADELAFSPLPVLTTEKDAVKLAALGDALPGRERTFVLPVRAELPEAFWVALLDALPARPHKVSP